MNKAEAGTDQGINSQKKFRARMRAQCSLIDQYRLAVLRDEGRRLTPDEAGLEWIERHAEAFARGNGDA